jgi:hypothetical protein
MFSDLAYSADGGDMVGSEIFVVYAGGPYYVMVQCAGGRLGRPELFQAIVNYPTLRFTIPSETATGCPSGEFVGTLSAAGLNATVKGTEWPGYLPRRKSYWQ